MFLSNSLESTRDAIIVLSHAEESYLCCGETFHKKPQTTGRFGKAVIVIAYKTQTSLGSKQTAGVILNSHQVSNQAHVFPQMFSAISTSGEICRQHPRQ